MFDRFILVTESGFYHSENAKCLPEIGLFAHDLFAFGTRSQEKVARSNAIPARSRQKPLAPAAWEDDIFDLAGVGIRRDRSLGRRPITLTQCEISPVSGNFGNDGGIFGEGLLNRGVHQFG